MGNEDISVKVENVSKKFCRSLKRSLAYGIKDIGRDALGLPKKDTLRKNEFWAVNDVSFEVKKGEAIGLIGPNGAGKSTLLKMLNGLIKPDKGKITMKGRVGALIELGTGFNPILSGRENVYINGTVLGLSKKEIDTKFDEIVAFSEIEEFIDTPVQNYSSGMRVRLGFAVAAILEPDILLIDEVLAVGDTRFRLKCFSHLEKLKQKGTAMIIVSHGLNQLSRICERAIVFNRGKKDFDGKLSSGIVRYDALMHIYSSILNNNYPLNEAGLSLIAETKNINGEPSKQFNTGETIIVDLVLGSNKEIKNGRLVCTVDSPNTGILGNFSTHSKIDLSIKKGSNRLRMSLYDFPLLLGTYFLNFTLFGEGRSDFLLNIKGLVQLEITGPERGQDGFGVNGIFLFRHKWQIDY